MGQNGLDAAHARAGALLLDDFERAQLARIFRVRAAADFLGKFSDGIGFHTRAVLAFENARKALRLRFLEGKLPHDAGNTLRDLRVDESFHRLDFLGRHGAGKIEIEPQALLGDVRAFLADVRGQHLLERRQQQVGGGVELSGLLFVIRKTAGKLLLAARLALALVLLKGRVIAVEIDAVAPFLRQ